MPRFEKRSPMPASADDLYAWHMAPGALEKLLPPWQKVRIVEGPGQLEEGAIVVMKVYVGFVGLRWEALHRDFIAGRQFVDEQRKGPFRRWVHTHRFEPQDDGTSVLCDLIDYEPPLFPLGRIGTLAIRRMLTRMFEFRHRATYDAMTAKAPLPSS